MYRVIFFGTESFAVKILQSLLEKPELFSVAAVVTQPARPVGRKQILTESPVALHAKECGIEVITPAKLKERAIAEQLAAYAADVFVVAQYGMIIPQSVLDIPPHGAINVHASLLPRHRGASPVHTAILAGDTETGVTFMKMDAQMDHGDLFAEYSLPILPSDTTETLMDKLADLSALHFPQDLHELLSGNRVATEQNHAAATGTKMLSRESGFVSFETMDAALIERMTRAYYPWPGVSIQIDDTVFKIIKAHTMPAHQSSTPGRLTVSDNGIEIETIDGVLVVDEIQPAGKNLMSAQQFSNGYKALSGKKCTTMSASSK